MVIQLVEIPNRELIGPTGERNIRTIWERCRAEVDAVTSEIQKLEEERDDLKKRLAINEAQQSKLCELFRVLVHHEIQFHESIAHHQ